MYRRGWLVQIATAVTDRRHSKSQSILTVNRAGAGDVFFNRWIAGIGNFSRASNGDLQSLGHRDFRVPCARRGDFSSPRLEPARF